MYSRGGGGGGGGFNTPYGNRLPGPRFGDGAAAYGSPRGLSPSFHSPPPVGSYGTPPRLGAGRWQSSPNQSFAGHRPATPRAYDEFYNRTPSPYASRSPSPYGSRPPHLPSRGGGAYSPRFFRGHSDGWRRAPQARGEENPGGSNNIMDYYNPNMLKDPWQGMTPVPSLWPN